MFSNWTIQLARQNGMNTVSLVNGSGEALFTLPAGRLDELWKAMEWRNDVAARAAELEWQMGYAA